MHLQKVVHPKMNPARGLMAVGCVLGALLIDLLAARLLAYLNETVAYALFWIAGLLIALWTLRRFVLSYSYIVSGSVLRISFAYGRYERTMADLYFNNLLFAGTPEEAKTRWPAARVNRAVLKDCPLEQMAAVFRDNGKPAIYLLQPDETVRAEIENQWKKRRKK